MARDHTVHPVRRMRVTMPSKTANDLLLTVLSPVCKIRETNGTEMVITMDFMTFGLFMAAVAQMEPAVPIKNLGIEFVDIRKDPVRITVRHGHTYPDEKET